MSELFNKKDLIYRVYEEGSISGASRKLYISQPSLSVMIKKVEDEIGSPLFDRSVKPLRLTDVGREYIRVTEEMYRLEHDFENYLDSLERLKRGDLHIGSNQLLSTMVLPPYIAGFITGYPNIHLTLLDGNSSTLVAGLTAGSLDVIIDNHMMDPEMFDMKYLHTEHLLLAVPKALDDVKEFEKRRLSRADILKGRHLGKRTRPVSLRPFSKIPFILMNKDNNIREHSDELFDAEDFSPRILLEVDRLVTLYNFIKTGTAASIVSDTLIENTVDTEDTINYYRLNDDLSKRDIFASYKKNRYVTKAMRTFLDSLSGDIFKKEG